MKRAIKFDQFAAVWVWCGGRGPVGVKLRLLHRDLIAAHHHMSFQPYLSDDGTTAWIDADLQDQRKVKKPWLGRADSTDEMSWKGQNVYHEHAKGGRSYCVRLSGMEGCFTIQARVGNTDVRIRVVPLDNESWALDNGSAFVLNGLQDAVAVVNSATKATPATSLLAANQPGNPVDIVPPSADPTKSSELPEGTGGKEGKEEQVDDASDEDDCGSNGGVLGVVPRKNLPTDDGEVAATEDLEPMICGLRPAIAFALRRLGFKGNEYEGSTASVSATTPDGVDNLFTRQRRRKGYKRRNTPMVLTGDDDEAEGSTDDAIAIIFDERSCSEKRKDSHRFRRNSENDEKLWIKDEGSTDDDSTGHSPTSKPVLRLIIP